MKKSFLRRKSKSEYRKYLDKADRALQDWYRAKFPNKKCEICGCPFELMHHHREKHLSAGLRFEHSNLIFVCSNCHSKIHFTNTKVSDIYVAKRGEKWLKDLLKLELATKNIVNTIQRSKEMIKKYGIREI